jgi:hypothetical protein
MARIEQMRAEARARERRRRAAWLGGAAVAVVVAVAVSRSGTASASREVIPPALTGTTTTEPAVTVPNTTGISGVVAYDTSGWPAGSHNGPASGALPSTPTHGYRAHL